MSLRRTAPLPMSTSDMSSSLVASATSPTLSNPAPRSFSYISSRSFFSRNDNSGGFCDDIDIIIIIIDIGHCGSADAITAETVSTENDISAATPPQRTQLTASISPMAIHTAYLDVKCILFTLVHRTFIHTTTHTTPPTPRPSLSLCCWLLNNSLSLCCWLLNNSLSLSVAGF